MQANLGPVKITVIIPFFQREPGLLTACAQSILSPQNLIDFEVIVVDDGSPVSAKDELALLSSAQRQKFRIIEQTNAGPGAARNKGLDHVRHDCAYVAFLDSDDCWTKNFLEDAICALDGGCDLFIGNSQRVGKELTRFEWDPSPSLNIDSGNHMPIDQERNLFMYKGDFFDLLVHRSSIISTTVLAYNFRKFGSIRFNETLYNGQDRLFKLSLGVAVDQVCFSPKVYAMEGAGVNIFDRSQWGSNRSLAFLSSYIELPKHILKEIELSSAQEVFVRSQLKELRYSFVASFIHLAFSRKGIDWKATGKIAKNDPLTIILFLPNLLKLLLDKFV